MSNNQTRTVTKTLFLLLLSILLLLLVAQAASAKGGHYCYTEEWPAIDEAGPNCEFIIYENDPETVFIRGTGDVTEPCPFLVDYVFFDEEANEESYKEYNIKHIIIEEGITNIGNTFSFYNGKRSYVTSITGPESLTSLPDYAFNLMEELTQVSFPGVTDIGKWCFNGCASLNQVSIENVRHIGDSAFRDRMNLVSFSMPKVETIGSEAFSGCENLTGVVLPSSLSDIGDYAFWGTGLQTITIPGSIGTINQGAFMGCANLTKATVLNGITDINDSAFMCCENLSDLSLPNSLISIGDGAFSDCYRLTDTYYDGSEAEWKKIVIDTDNDPLLNATKHFAGGSSEPYTKPSEEKPAEKLNFFQRIIQWFRNLFARLFGR